MGLTNQRLLEMFVNDEYLEMKICTYEITKFETYNCLDFDQIEIIADVLAKVTLVNLAEYELHFKKNGFEHKCG
jgi:hypothetical protein